MINCICMLNSIIPETERTHSQCQSEVVDAAVQKDEVVEMLAQRLSKKKEEMSSLFTHITCVNI